MLNWKQCLLSLGVATGLVISPLGVISPVFAAQQKVVKKASTKASSKKTRTVKRASAKKTVKATKRQITKKAHQAKSNRRYAKRATRRAVSRGPSQATLAGLRNTKDPLDLGSSVAYIVDQDTGEELLSKNAGVPLPIASVTKLMTALVVAESGINMDETVLITREDYLPSSASSKLRNGMKIKRSELLKAALMSSDNRAAHALARTFPQGKAKFISLMNETADRLGMRDSAFADPTGLDNRNHSTARDLAKLVGAAYEYGDIRRASTLPAAQVKAGRYVLNMHTTNRLIGNPDWNIGIQKTGFTTAAGRCMVIQSEVGPRRVVMVVLDSPNNTQRATDMTTMKRFVEAENRWDRQFSNVNPYELF